VRHGLIGLAQRLSGELGSDNAGVGWSLGRRCIVTQYLSNLGTYIEAANAGNFKLTMELQVN
jgi:hypothetical protein